MSFKLFSRAGILRTSLATIAATLCASPLRSESAAASSSIPAEAFFAPVGLNTPKLSPDGTKLCALILYDDTHYCLTGIDVATKRPKVLVKTEGLSVVNFWWKGNDLLLLLTEAKPGERIFQSLNLLTGKTTILEAMEPQMGLQFLHELPGQPDEMLFALLRYNVMPHQVVHFNVRTGNYRSVVANPDISMWLANHEGEVVAGIGYSNGTPLLLWREHANNKLQPVNYPKDLEVFALAPDQKRLIARDFRGHSIPAICFYDPATGATEEILAAGEMQPSPLTWGRNEDVVALKHTLNDREIHFINPKIEAVYRSLERAIPESELTFTSFSEDNKLAVVFARSDRNPGIYYLADLDTKKLSALGASYPLINPTKTARSRLFSFTTSDGLPMTGSITAPLDIEKPPLVLLVGTSLTGEPTQGRFEFVPQFLASRGFAVARINHRGTLRFGKDFTAAADFQVGTGMVRDLSESVQWLSQKGWIDPERIAVLGGDQGGLLAFQFATTLKGKCALVNFGTPFEPLWKTFTFSWKTEEEHLKQIGGLKAARDYAKSMEPLRTADRLTIPSWHFYPVDQTRPAQQLKAKLASRSLPCDLSFLDTTEEKTKASLVAWKRSARRYEDIAAFLQKHLQ